MKKKKTPDPVPHERAGVNGKRALREEDPVSRFIVRG
jgi:hypothetical protein